MDPKSSRIYLCQDTCSRGEGGRCEKGGRWRVTRQKELPEAWKGYRIMQDRDFSFGFCHEHAEFKVNVFK